eukprot:103510-Pleurochrysis_carterae.AAC.5
MMYRRRSVDGRVVRDQEGVMPIPHLHWLLLAVPQYCGVPSSSKDMHNPSTQVMNAGDTPASSSSRRAGRSTLTPVLRCTRFVHVVVAGLRKPGRLRKPG